MYFLSTFPCSPYPSRKSHITLVKKIPKISKTGVVESLRLTTWRQKMQAVNEKNHSGLVSSH